MSESEIRRDAAVEKAQGHQWGPILVGTDGSEGAARAVDAAGGLAADLDTELWITTVIDSVGEVAAAQFARAEDTSIGDVADAVAGRILQEAARRAEACGAKKNPHGPAVGKFRRSTRRGRLRHRREGDLCRQTRRRRTTEPSPDRQRLPEAGGNLADHAGDRPLNLIVPAVPSLSRRLTWVNAIQFRRVI